MCTLPNGLQIIPNYINSEYAEYLMDNINNSEWNRILKRLIQQYYYDYPDWLIQLSQKLVEDNYMNIIPDQVIINRYLPGEIISPHIDAPKLFGNQIACLSLGSACKIKFKKNEEVHIINLEPNTLVIMEDDIRYKYMHSISGVKINTRYSITFRNILF
jgi:alkylated DNA repair dioxygenase AlkB